MKVFKFILSLFAGMVCLSCSSEYVRTDSLHIDLTKVDADSVAYSEFVDSISYLDLQTTDSSLIANIRNLCFTDSLIAVFDDRSQKVALFGNDGRFVRLIGGVGQGPGEYLRATAMDVDPEDGVVMVYDAPRCAVLKYGFDNSFVGMDSVGRADDFRYVGDGRYLLANYNDPSDNAGIYLVDVSDKESRKLRSCRDDIAMNKPWELFDSDGRVSVFTRQFEDCLLTWDGDSLVEEMELDIIPSPSDADKARMKESRQERRLHADRIGFGVSPRWVYACYWLGNEIRYVFCDREKGEPVVTSDLVNDIDGVYGLRLPVCHDDSFVNAVKGKDDESNPRLQFLHLKK